MEGVVGGWIYLQMVIGVAGSPTKAPSLSVIELDCVQFN